MVFDLADGTLIREEASTRFAPTVDKNVDAGASSFYVAQHASTSSRHLLETEAIENRSIPAHAGIR
jgi:hypothetical protein